MWQLATNSAVSLLAVWFAFRRGDDLTAGTLVFLATGGFCFAYLLRSVYGGTMEHSDGSELLLLGVNPSVGTMVLLCAWSVAAVMAGARARSRTSSARA